MEAGQNAPEAHETGSIGAGDVVAAHRVNQVEVQANDEAGDEPSGAVKPRSLGVRDGEPEGRQDDRAQQAVGEDERAGALLGYGADEGVSVAEAGDVSQIG